MTWKIQIIYDTGLLQNGQKYILKENTVFTWIEKNTQ